MLTTTPNPTKEALQGVIERITFHNEINGFCVVRVKVLGRRDLVTVVGQHTLPKVGEQINCHGSWACDNRHGLQFRADQLLTVIPGTLEGIERYLGSGLIKGIGPHFAKVLVTTFGAEVFDIIESNPQKLATVPGIGDKRIDQIRQAWVEQKTIHTIMVFLQSHGIGTARAVKIYTLYGKNAIQTVSENPYRLALDIHGIGFQTADILAQRLGIAPDSVSRAEAGLRHILQEQAKEGHCAIPTSKLLAQAEQLLNIPDIVLQQALSRALQQAHIFTEQFDHLAEPLVYLAPLYYAETGVAQHLHRLMTKPARFLLTVSNSIAEQLQRDQPQLSASQRQAILGVLCHKLAIITGGPGVGKTTVIKIILAMLADTTAHIVLCAPTGRAAKRLAETTGMSAKTLHRLLEYDPSQHRFKRDGYNPIRADLLILDEVSMVDVVLAFQLLRALSDTAQVVFVGDVDQLPAVGPGDVLSDLSESGAIPTYRLTEVFRQAAGSQIILNAHRINQGKLPLVATTEPSDFYVIAAETPEQIQARVLQLVAERIPRRFGLDPIEAIQVLTPSNRGSLGARNLNVLLQQRLNPDRGPKISYLGNTYAPADKVIQLVNNYDTEIFNGDIGKIIEVDPETSSLVVDFSGRAVRYPLNQLDEIALAYACTIHKSQGSEYPAVIIPVSTQHYLLLKRNLIYTAVTRGKQLVVIVGQPKALAIAIKTLQAKKRLTQLCQRLQHWLI